MNFIDRCPSTWEELQDYVALLLNQAGYHAMSPCTIDTVRGQVEVDVLVESPDVLVKKIICECKFWKTPVPKEKVHAFRTVVHDSGAALGLLISRVGFQSGAIEAAKFSNVQLLTWEEFTNLIADKWIIETLKRIKKKCDCVAEYVNPLHFPYEELKETDKGRYIAASEKYTGLKITCWQLSRSALKQDWPILERCYSIEKFSSIVDYLNYLETEVEQAVSVFETITASSGIVIPEERFEKLEAYTFLNLD